MNLEWSEDEHELLLALWPRHRPIGISAAMMSVGFDRTPKAVAAKARQLGLGRSENLSPRRSRPDSGYVEPTVVDYAKPLDIPCDAFADDDPRAAAPERRFRRSPEPALSNGSSMGFSL